MMLDNFKKLVPIALSQLVTGASLLSASDYETRISQLEAKVNDVSMNTVVDTKGGRTANYHPKAYGEGFFVTGDFLWWQAEQDGLEYAVVTDVYTGPESVYNHGRVKEIGFEWGPGFRVGLGYNLPWDGWDLYANWTHFHKDSHSHVSAPSDKNVSPVWSAYLNTPKNRASEASAHYGLTYNILDLELGRNFFASHSLSLRPFIGIRGAWIDQDVRYEYENLQVVVPPKDEHNKLKNDFNAGGFRAGFNTTWHFTRNWGIFGNIAASLMYGEFHVAQKLHWPNAFGAIIDQKEEIDLVRGNLELGAGLLWEAYFSKGRYHLALTAAYEVLQWFSQNQLLQFSDPTKLALSSNGTINQKKDGDLGLHGGTLSARFDF
ncbi:MAG TPA: Lpg1974 family pore-forming outer membrane protein [Rhabdochlamydiaceae bacterium]|nr:Lpg1974 family pore-forming outer membrane protein [Rhabdochlamydiaceae bacterium]